jgi:GNAT superfamily N-acetyltransferase
MVLMQTVAADHVHKIYRHHGSCCLFRLARLRRIETLVIDDRAIDARGFLDHAAREISRVAMTAGILHAVPSNGPERKFPRGKGAVVANPRCADFRRYLSLGLDPQCLMAMTPADVRTAHAGGRVRRLDWDSDFFGVPAGRLEGLWRDAAVPADAAWAELVPALLARASALGLVFLDVRIAAEDLALAQVLEAGGFRLTDTLAIYLSDLRHTGRAAPLPRATDVEAFLRTALHGMEWGRLFADPFVPRAKAEEFYLRTSLHYLAQGALTTILFEGSEPAGIALGVADEEGSRLAGAALGVLWLFIVAPKHQGKGIGKRLFNQFCAEFSSLVDFVEIGTQIQHGAANRIYRADGNLPATHALTFHRWAE